MLNKPYKFKRADFDQILFTSDQHFNHDPKWNTPPLWKLRGFDSIQEHDKWMMNQYKGVSEKSLIISLGDPALNSTPENLLALFNQTAAPILHIWGNHFSCDYRIYKNVVNRLFDNEPEEPLNFEIYPLTVNRNNTNFAGQSAGMNIEPYSLVFLGMQADIQIDRNLIHLSHFAPLIWTRNTIGCVYGHSHGDHNGSQPEDKNEGKRLDSGVDNSIKYNGTAFFTYEEIVHILNSKPAKVIDHA